MKEQRITIEITSEGRITADADGFSGGECLRDLDRLLEGLAPGNSTVKRKSEFDKGNVIKNTKQIMQKRS